ncbi:MAG: hypothetical protein PVF40_11275, partial [Ectothiorhodospiraceae bacterium]
MSPRRIPGWQSATLVVVLLAALPALVGGLRPLLGMLDEALYGLASTLRPVDTRSPVTVVEIPPPEPVGGERTENRLKLLSRTLETIAGAHPAAVALVADRALALPLTWSAEGARVLHDARGDGVLLGWPADLPAPPGGSVPAVRPTPTRASPLTAYWPAFARLHPLQQAPFATAYPMVANGSSRRPLVWRHGETLVPGLAAAAVGRALQSDGLVWREGVSLGVGELSIPTDLGGGAYAPTAAQSALVPQQWTRVPSAQKAAALKGRVVLVGAAGSASLKAVSRLVAGALNRTAVATPWWASLSVLATLAVIAVYLVAMVPRLGAVGAISLSLLLGLGIAVAAVGILLLRGVWVPVGTPLALLVVGYPLARFGRLRRRARTRERRQTDRVRRSLASYQLGAGELAGAMDNLRRCAPTDDVLELMYRVALAQERHRDYRSAADAFRGIQQRRAGYRDVDEHLRALESSASGGGAGATGATAQTLVLPSGALQRPVLGRYEIERELGRGAMGVVYLGKDPKIGRQVAIKTLEYAQFEAGELAMFRERFTREAEAAGRLNHPGIVTVYDVGEEDDLA